MEFSAISAQQSAEISTINSLYQSKGLMPSGIGPFMSYPSTMLIIIFYFCIMPYVTPIALVGQGSPRFKAFLQFL